MLPPPDTVDAIVSIVKALNEHKTWKVELKELKSGLSSLEALLPIWIPALLFILVCSLALIYFIWVPSPWLVVASYLLLFFIYVSIFVSQIRTISTTLSLNTIIENVRKLAHTDAPHVNELFKYPRQDLQYVLVELKAERVAWERRLGVLIGAQEKIGIIPGLIALFAALVRPQGVVPSWIVGVAYVVPLLYFCGLWSHILMTKLDRGIMVLEMVIDTKQSESGDPHEGMEPMC
jgi:hypothetical protein